MSSGNYRRPFHMLVESVIVHFAHSGFRMIL